jgi:hypothetical protein
MSFGDIVWFIVIAFAFTAYLVVLFHICADLFRDQDASGLAKAVWVVALILVPILASLVYLAVRGKGMAERSIRSAETLKQEQDAYIREVAAQTTPADQIAQAKSMLDAGAITQSEYDRLKAKALT